jgi:hypothetical protein
MYRTPAKAQVNAVTPLSSFLPVRFSGAVEERALATSDKKAGRPGGARPTWLARREGSICAPPLVSRACRSTTG